MIRSTLLLTLVLASGFAIAFAAETSQNDTALRAQGKKIFVARCSQCHDEDASKKLPDGTTLLQRLTKNGNPEARLQGRLKDAEERHAVMMYLMQFLTAGRHSAPGQGTSSTDPR